MRQDAATIEQSEVLVGEIGYDPKFARLVVDQARMTFSHTEIDEAIKVAGGSENNWRWRSLEDYQAWRAYFESSIGFRLEDSFRDIIETTSFSGIRLFELDGISDLKERPQLSEKHQEAVSRLLNRCLEVLEDLRQAMRPVIENEKAASRIAIESESSDDDLSVDDFKVAGKFIAVYANYMNALRSCINDLRDHQAEIEKATATINQCQGHLP